MDIFLLKQSEVSSLAATATGKFNLAVNKVIPSANSTTVSTTNTIYTIYQSLQASGGIKNGVQIAGDNDPVVDVTPKFFPVATAGAECAALVSSLNWADNNLGTYEYIKLGSSSYFVTGVLNSSQTQANDPFNSTDSPGFVSGSCWAADYAPGLNPF